MLSECFYISKKSGRGLNVKRVTLISSTGGHWTQLNNIYKEFQKIDAIESRVKIKLITEKNDSNKDNKNVDFLYQQDRKSKNLIFILILNTILSLYYVIRYRPHYVISTGAGGTILYLIFAKLMGSKVIFIESYAKINSPTITGKIVYKFADIFYVQWPEMLKFYPKGIYKGSLY